VTFHIGCIKPTINIIIIIIIIITTLIILLWALGAIPLVF